MIKFTKNAISDGKYSWHHKKIPLWREEFVRKRKPILRPTFFLPVGLECTTQQKYF